MHAAAPEKTWARQWNNSLHARVSSAERPGRLLEVLVERWVDQEVSRLLVRLTLKCAWCLHLGSLRGDLGRLSVIPSSLSVSICERRKVSPYVARALSGSSELPEGPRLQGTGGCEGTLAGWEV